MEDVSNRVPLLMTPGPTEVEQRVLDALSKRPMLHYGGTWKTFYTSTLELMRELFGAETDDQMLLVPAPGSACLEMAIANLARPEDKILNLRNGYFGEITKESAERHGINVVEPKTPYGKPVSASEVKRLLEENRDIAAVVLVHNETSTGVVNPVEEVGTLARAYGVPLIVDAVSSFGAVRTHMKEWNCAICIGYSSKGLSGIAGVVPVAVNREVWNKATRRDFGHSAGRFLSFQVWDRYIHEWGSWGHPFPTTMPTSIIQALNAAARIALEEGLDKRAERHRLVAAKLRKEVRSMGLEILPEESYSSSTVTAISLSNPAQEEAKAVMEKEFGVVISGGLSELKGKILRIGHMGATATDACIERTAGAMEKSLKKVSDGSNL